MSSMRIMLTMPLIGFCLTGCVGGNPVSHTIGLTQAGVITSQEQARYQSMSCPELRQMAANYETGLTASPAAKKYGGAAPAGKHAIAMKVITTRLAYLKQVMASKGC
jgi:hypothetical protein